MWWVVVVVVGCGLAHSVGWYCVRNTHFGETHTLDSVHVLIVV